MSADQQVLLSALIGLISGIIIGILVGWKYAPLAAWDIAAIIFLLWVWPVVFSTNAEQTARLALRENPDRTSADVLLVLASVVSLAAVGVLVAQAKSTGGTGQIIEVGLGVASVIVSWAVIHTVYTLKYARLFYKNQSGIEFNDNAPPRYSDFAYLALTIGMTFQVSDTTLKSNEFRRLALRHALLSYLFGIVIVATIINLIAGLGR
jgi:uncharacterized membrane protein